MFYLFVSIFHILFLVFLIYSAGKVWQTWHLKCCTQKKSVKFIKLLDLIFTSSILNFTSLRLWTVIDFRETDRNKQVLDAILSRNSFRRLVVRTIYFGRDTEFKFHYDWAVSNIRQKILVSQATASRGFLIFDRNKQIHVHCVDFTCSS
jgi:hypothetical protein